MVPTARHMIPLLFRMLLFNAHLTFATTQVMINFLRLRLFFIFLRSCFSKQKMPAWQPGILGPCVHPQSRLPAGQSHPAPIPKGPLPGSVLEAVGASPARARLRRLLNWLPDLSGTVKRGQGTGRTLGKMATLPCTISFSLLCSVPVVPWPLG